ncbi:MAG: hypothetical protein Q8N05_07050 [Bacteroidota bacterium]|nr:hypothetical protein [Bacteroidota bacterium]
MKTILALVSVLMVFLLASCQLNEITFGSTDIDLAKSAEVRLVYDAPLVTSSTQSLTRLTYNDQLVSEVTTALGGIFPNSSARYHVVPQGSVKVDVYKSTTKDVLQYSNSFTVASGKYSVFIHSLTEVPFVVKDADVFPSSDAWADTLAHIQFVNLFYKADGVTPYGTLFLKGRRGAGTTASPYKYIDIASCGFKEASKLIPYKLVKSGTVWSGTETAMVFAVFDAAGKLLKAYPTSTGALADVVFTGFQLGKGRNYIFHINGKEGAKYAEQSIRLSTIVLN